MLDDLAAALARKDGEPYFLGSVVLIKDGRNTRTEVIDGQQRLTTLTILIAVLRDLAEEPEVTKNLMQMIAEPGNVVMGLEAKPRLKLRPRDADFFRQRIQTQGSIAGLLELNPEILKTDSQRAVLANTKALHDELSTWTDEQRLALSSVLSLQTFLVAVSTPNLNSAHRIFSVMNARGMNLLPADIFKAQIIGDIGGADSETYAMRWEDAEEDLGRSDFADLFLHIRMIFSGERARFELLKEFQEQVLDRYKQGRAKEFVDEVLVPYAEAFAMIREKRYEAGQGSARVNQWFGRLLQLDNGDWWPAALWAVRHHAGDPQWLSKFFESLERLATSMFIRRIYTTPRVQRYAELLKELNAGEGLTAAALQLTDEESAATLQALDGDVYNETKTRRYILLRLSELVAEDDVVATYAAPHITVEHVLPQRPKPDSQWQLDFTTAQRAQWTNRLANLVLLSNRKNAQAQNYEFAQKKEKYLQSVVVNRLVFGGGLLVGRVRVRTRVPVIARA